MNFIKKIPKICFEAHFLFAIIAVIAGMCVIRTIPPLWGSDETTHVSRVYQLSHGTIIAPKDANGMYGGAIPVNIMALILFNAQETTGTPNVTTQEPPFADRRDVRNPDGYTQYLAEPLSDQTELFAFPNTASFSPLAYLGPLPGFALGQAMHASLGTVLDLARLSALLLYCAVITASLWLLRASRLKWLVFVVALFPTSVIQASLISVDGIVIATTILLFSAVIASRQGKRPLADNKLLTVIAAAAVVLPLTKPTYFPVLAILFFVPPGMFAQTWQRLTYKIGVPVLSLGMLVFWMFFTRAIAQNTAMIEGPEIAALVDPAKQVEFILSHPLDAIKTYINTMLTNNQFFTIGAIGALGWNGFIPTALAFFAVFVLTTALLYRDEKSEPERPLRLTSLLAGLAAIGMVFTTFYVAYTPVGLQTIYGVQGRYFIAVLPMIGYGLQAVIPFRLAGTFNPALWFGGSAAFLLAASLVFYHGILY
ncbi:MAG TPA: DUF2142 domain-containing protein [Magnetospirillaceae bacterium]|nr:DUF2142 domain-containing protein [Magnetospirillaceae bacterium]